MGQSLMRCYYACRSCKPIHFNCIAHLTELKYFWQQRPKMEKSMSVSVISALLCYSSALYGVCWQRLCLDPVTCLLSWFIFSCCVPLLHIWCGSSLFHGRSVLLIALHECDSGHIVTCLWETLCWYVDLLSHICSKPVMNYFVSQADCLLIKLILNILSDWSRVTCEAVLKHRFQAGTWVSYSVYRQSFVNWIPCNEYAMNKIRLTPHF